MDPELQRQLEEIHALARDTHRLARAMRRHQIYSVIMTAVFWVVIILAPVYLYQQYIQPFVAKFSVTTGVEPSGPFGLPTTADLQKLINSFKVGN